MKHLLAIPVLALGLSGCEVVDKITTRDPVKEVIVGCNTITSALNVLAPNIDRLSDAQVGTVDRVRHMSEPICSTENPPATADALITDLVTQIVAVQTSVAEDS